MVLWFSSNQTSESDSNRPDWQSSSVGLSDWEQVQNEMKNNDCISIVLLSKVL